jgi:hypothetical protein
MTQYAPDAFKVTDLSPEQQAEYWRTRFGYTGTGTPTDADLGYTPPAGPQSPTSPISRTPYSLNTGFDDSLRVLTGGSGGLASLLEDPEALSAYTRPQDFMMPRTQEALDAFRNLQLESASGLRDVLAHPAQGQPEIERALFERQREDVERLALRERQKSTEGAFGRGVGLSTILNDRLTDINREEMDATTRARREAILGAGAEARAQEGARLAALGQGYQMGTGGLQSDANVFFQNARNEAAANQFGISTAATNMTNRLNRELQEQQFATELNSREDLEKRRHDLARELQRNQLLASGIGAGIGGLAGLFAPPTRG